MLNKSQNIILLILLSIFLMNCSVSKRHYRKGYQVVWHYNSKSETKQLVQSKNLPVQHRVKDLETKLDKMLDMTRTELTASAENMKTIALKKFKPKAMLDVKDTCGDVLIFRDGTELTVKVVEVYNNMIKYLPCNNLDGPLRVANGDKIFMVKYANGTKEVFKEQVKASPVYNQPSAPKERKTNGLAVASFICGMLWFFIVPAFVAVILGTIALNQMSTQPDKYKGKWMAKFGVIVGGIFSFLYILSFVYQ